MSDRIQLNVHTSVEDRLDRIRHTVNVLEALFRAQSESREPLDSAAAAGVRHQLGAVRAEIEMLFMLPPDVLNQHLDGPREFTIDLDA